MVVLIILVMGLCTSLAVHFSHLGYWQRHEAFYYDHGTPLMSTLDAYYYLQEASELTKGQNSAALDGVLLQRQVARPSLLARMAAFIHKATGLSLERIAFYLPPVLGSCIVAVYICWGYSLAGPAVALLASLAGVSSLYWYSRTCLGRFDTDCLNPFFVYTILFLVYRFVSSKGRARLFYLGAAILTAYLFSIWWVQVSSIGFILIILSYCLSFYLPSGKTERIIKVSVLVGAVLVVLCAISSLRFILPERLSDFINAYVGQFFLINSSSVVSSFPNVGKSITELQPSSIAVMSKEVGGHFVPFIVSVIGFCCLLKRNRHAACFLISGLILASLSLAARRFLIFLVPSYALGLGYFLGEVLLKRQLPRCLVNRAARWGVFGVVTVALLLPNYCLSMTRQIGPSLTRGDVFLARQINERAPDKALIWSWWDYGYFLRYITGRRVFIDGGTQSARRTFIAAFPLACGDPVLARNWMRFFAAHGLNGLHRLIICTGSQEEALSLLHEVLAQPGKASRILRARGWPEKKWIPYFFPEAPVFLYLNRSIFRKTYWWYYFGSWNPERGEGAHPEFWMVRITNRNMLAREGTVTIDKRAVKVNSVVEVGLKGGTLMPITPAGDNEGQFLPAQINTPGDGGHIHASRTAITVGHSDLVYVLDDRALKALAFRLSFLLPHDTPGFDPIVYYPVLGGVWRVE